MIKYNIKMFINFIVFIAVFTFCGFAVLTKCSDISNVTNIWPNIGKTATIVFSIVLIFEKWAWKWKLLHGWLIPTPNIKGEWVGLFIEKGDKTMIDFTENIVRKKPVPKILLKLYLKKQQKLYLRDLNKELEKRQ